MTIQIKLTCDKCHKPSLVNIERYRRGYPASLSNTDATGLDKFGWVSRGNKDFCPNCANDYGCTG